MSDAKNDTDGDSTSAETLPGRTKSPYARPAAEEKRRMGLAETLPKGAPAVAMSDTLPLGSRRPEEPRGGTFPPVAWDREDIISSAAPSGGERADSPAPGGLHQPASEHHLGEDDARALLTTRFTTAGISLVADYPFQRDDLAVTLDGYDPERKIGFAYLSHADADVVTDFDEATELAFQELARDGVAQVLVVHDSDTPNADVLERRIDAFFAALQR